MAETKKTALLKIDVYSSTLSMLQILFALFTIMTGLLDFFFIINNTVIDNETNNLIINPSIIKFIIFLTLLALTFITTSTLRSCWTLLVYTWQTEGFTGHLAGQLIAIMTTTALIYLGNLFILVYN